VNLATDFQPPNPPEFSCFLEAAIEVEDITYTSRRNNLVEHHEMKVIDTLNHPRRQLRRFSPFVCFDLITT
jgi:hypothetical protein